MSKKFEFIIECCVQLINCEIINHNFPKSLISKIVTEEDFHKKRRNLMQNCNTYRSKLRENLMKEEPPILAQLAFNEQEARRRTETEPVSVTRKLPVQVQTLRSTPKPIRTRFTERFLDLQLFLFEP